MGDDKLAVQCYSVRETQGAWTVHAQRLTIAIASEENIISLRIAIKKQGHEMGLFAVDEGIELWLPKDNIQTGPNAPAVINAMLEGHTLGDVAEPADDLNTVASVMRKVRSPRQLDTHVLVQVSSPPHIPAPPADPTVDGVHIFKHKLQELLDNTQATKSPSVNAKSQEYCEHQGSSFPILDGRCNPAKNSPATYGPPIELFSPVFAEFRALAADVTLEIPSKVISQTASLMRSVSAIRSKEDKRTYYTQKFLDSMKPFIHHQNVDKSAADHMALGQTTKFSRPEHTALAIVEEMVEIGTGGDPSVQGCFSYTKYWVGNEHSQVREECCCPTFIVGLADSWLVILGAVTTSQYIFQRLTDYLWLGNSRVGDDAHVISVARSLYALGRSLSSLDQFYAQLEVRPVTCGSVQPRFLPWIASYPQGNEAPIAFTYVKPLELDSACMTFLATLNSDGLEVVVKFVQRYGDAVHQLMAERAMAPELLYCGSVDNDPRHSFGGLKMVVMRYIRGKTLAERFGGETIPESVKEAIRAGLTAIHEDGYVYGDLRRPNVMIADDDSGDLGKQVRFIDFDWAGRAGHVRYPLHLAQAVRDAAGASDYALITKEHDSAMFKAL